MKNIKPLLLLSIIILFLGAGIGATTNAINGFVSPSYFKNILGWDFDKVWGAAVAQGIFEGLIYGFIFTIVTLISILVFVKGELILKKILASILKVVAFIYLCWLVGGLIAVCLAILSPDFYRSAIYLVPQEYNEMLKYAWVGGSIQGGIYGGLIGAIFLSILIKNSKNEA